MPMDDKPLDGVREGRRGWEWGRRGLKWAAGRRLTVAGGATVLALHAHAHAHAHVYTHTHTHTHTEQVVFTLSGYVDPARSELRKAGLKLGGLPSLPCALRTDERPTQACAHVRVPSDAELRVVCPVPACYRQNFERGVTHVCSAFENTPKNKEAGNARWTVAVVNGDWLRECKKESRRVPEAAFAWGAAVTPPTLPTPAPAPVPAPAPPTLPSQAGRGRASDGDGARDTSPARKRARADGGGASGASSSRSNSGSGASSVPLPDATEVKVKKEPAKNADSAGKEDKGGQADDGLASPAASGTGSGGASSPVVVVSKVSNDSHPSCCLETVFCAGAWACPHFCEVCECAVT